MINRIEEKNIIKVHYENQVNQGSDNVLAKLACSNEKSG